MPKDNVLSSSKPTSEYQFGFQTMGPIIAECCFLLNKHLSNEIDVENDSVLFCARGGLVIKQALDIYLSAIGQNTFLKSRDFMVSRLAASRLALITDPSQVASYLALEFEGRTCGEVAKALTGEDYLAEGLWLKPYSLKLLLELFNEEQGAIYKNSLIAQANLFKEHFLSLTKSNQVVHIIDTGVFGSIGHFLQASFPEIRVNSVLLFKANYKPSDIKLNSSVIGLVSSENSYCPWQVRSVSRLYWPFIEAFFEPDLSSVNTFTKDDKGIVVSNLELTNWEEHIKPNRGTMRAGAFDYLANLNSGSLNSIQDDALRAWQSLRKRIIYPDVRDLELLAVNGRSLDFGFDDRVSFAEQQKPLSYLKRISVIQNSIWPEGEVKRLFPKISKCLLFVMELYRYNIAWLTTLKKTWKSFLR